MPWALPSGGERGEGLGEVTVAVAGHQLLLPRHPDAGGAGLRDPGRARRERGRRSRRLPSPPGPAAWQAGRAVHLAGDGIEPRQRVDVRAPRTGTSRSGPAGRSSRTAPARSPDSRTPSRSRAVRRIGEPAQPQPLLRVPGVGLHHQDAITPACGSAATAFLGWRQLRPIERHAAHALGPQLCERAHARPQPAEPDLGPGKHRIGRQVEKHIIRTDFDGRARSIASSWVRSATQRANPVIARTARRDREQVAAQRTVPA